MDIACFLQGLLLYPVGTASHLKETDCSSCICPSFLQGLSLPLQTPPCFYRGLPLSLWPFIGGCPLAAYLYTASPQTADATFVYRKLLPSPSPSPCRGLLYTLLTHPEFHRGFYTTLPPTYRHTLTTGSPVPTPTTSSRSLQ